MYVNAPTNCIDLLTVLRANLSASDSSKVGLKSLPIGSKGACFVDTF